MKDRTNERKIDLVHEVPVPDFEGASLQGLHLPGCLTIREESRETLNESRTKENGGHTLVNTSTLAFLPDPCGSTSLPLMGILQHQNQRPTSDFYTCQFWKHFDKGYPCFWVVPILTWIISSKPFTDSFFKAVRAATRSIPRSSRPFKCSFCCSFKALRCSQWNPRTDTI